MTDKSMDEQIIENYQSDEKVMILIYAQWCINHDLDPKALYLKAYPDQVKNEALKEALDLTVLKEESDQIDDNTVLHILQVFDNHDLAFIVQEEIEKRDK